MKQETGTKMLVRLQWLQPCTRIICQIMDKKILRTYTDQGIQKRGGTVYNFRIIFFTPLGDLRTCICMPSEYFCGNFVL